MTGSVNLRRGILLALGLLAVILITASAWYVGPKLGIAPLAAVILLALLAGFGAIASLPGDAKRLPMGAAGVSILAMGAAGGMLLLTSAVSFDYMRLRDLPVYASAAGVEQFTEAAENVRSGINASNESVGVRMQEMATLDVMIADAEDASDAARGDAKNFLRNLARSKPEVVRLSSLGISFGELEAAFIRQCAGEPAAGVVASGAALLPAGVTEANAAGDPPVDPSNMDPAAVTQACTAPDACTAIGAEVGASTFRGRMICAERSLQKLLRRKEQRAGFAYDSAHLTSSLLRLNYPTITADEIDRVIHVTEAYRNLTGRCAASAGTTSANSEAGTPETLCIRRAPWEALLRDLIHFPLAASYFLLAALFGAMGALVRFLFEHAAPGQHPEEGMIYAGLAGGGAGVLVVVILLAGFQFLTAGATSADLAYPNPLTVCGISVLTGLGGRGVLNALQRLVERITGGPEEIKTGLKRVEGKPPE